MKRISTLFLRAAIILIGVVVLALCVFALPAMWRAVPSEFPNYTYVFYSILSAFYIGAIPFYIALYQGLQLLKYIDDGKSFSVLSVTALKRIASSALSISIIFIASMPFFYIWADKDDAPGLVVISMFFVVAPFVIAVFAALLQRLFQEAIDIKSENDLTV